MKKTLTINLGGIVYHIDDDAYRLLDNYLSNLKHFFRRQKGAEEIVNDIEMRISELFAGRVSDRKQVITVEDVEEIISQVGKPEDFGINENAENSEEKDSTSSEARGGGTTMWQRRWFRDPDNKMLGGVAAGLAAYLGWDVTLLRILMILLLFMPYCPMPILYIIGWIVIPEARTASEKLSMRGEAVTIENIGKTVTDGFDRVANGVNDYMHSDAPRSFLQKVGDAFVSIIGLLFKVCLIAVIIMFCPVLLVLVIALVALVIATITMSLTGSALLYDAIFTHIQLPVTFSSPLMMLAGIIAAVGLIGIPVGSFFYFLMRQLFHWNPMKSGTKWSLLILWLTSIALMGISLSAINWQPLYDWNLLEVI